MSVTCLRKNRVLQRKRTQRFCICCKIFASSWLYNVRGLW